MAGLTAQILKEQRLEQATLIVNQLSKASKALKTKGK
jgi:hypothetical protein